MKYIKAQYKNTIKKLVFSEKEYSYDTLTKKILKTFNFNDKSKIKICYKDKENDEITVDSDEDLIAALSYFYVEKFIKFFVLYEIDGESGDDPFLGRIDELDSCMEASKKPNLPFEQSTEKIEIKEEKDLPEEKKIQEIPIEWKDLAEIFDQAFKKASVFEEIQKLISDFIGTKKKEILSHNSQITEYNIATDYQALSEYFKKILNSTINQRLFQQPDGNQIESKDKPNETDSSIEKPIFFEVGLKFTESKCLPPEEKSIIIPENEKRGTLQENNTEEKPLEIAKEWQEKNPYETTEVKKEVDDQSKSNPTVSTSVSSFKVGKKLEIFHSIEDASVVESLYEILSLDENESDMTFKEFDDLSKDEKSVISLMKSKSDVGPLVKNLNNKAEGSKIRIRDNSFSIIGQSRIFDQEAKASRQINLNKEEFQNNILKHVDHDLDNDLPAPYFLRKTKSSLESS